MPTGIVRTLATLLLCTVPLPLDAGAPAGLPPPPNEAEVAALIEKTRAQAAGDTTPAARQRIQDVIRDMAGSRPRLHNHAGILLVLKGYPREALWCFAEAASADPSSVDALNNLALLLTEQEEHFAALRLLLHVAHRWPGFPAAYINLGRIWCDLGVWNLAEIAAAHVYALDPGRQDTEALLARSALGRGDTAAAARHVANLSAIDPENRRLPDLAARIPPAQMQQAITNVFAAAPLPANLVELPQMHSDVRQFVYRELDSPFWRPVNAQVQGNVMPGYETGTITPEMWDALPEHTKALLRSHGLDAGSATEAAAPGFSRADYPTLSGLIHAYEMKYINQVKTIYKSSGILDIILAEGKRQGGYKKDYFEVLKASQNPHAAAAAWSRQAMPSLIRTHAQMRPLLKDARDETVRLTIELWHTVRTLIGMVPTAHYEKEAQFLVTKVVNYHNQHYAGSIHAWHMNAMQVILFEDHLNDAAPRTLHEAAAGREFDAWCRRQAALENAEQRAWEAWHASLGNRNAPWFLGRGATDRPFWVGLDLGTFAIKWDGASLSVSGGEGLVGDATYSFDRNDFTLGIGVGGGIPLGPGGAVSAKEMAVLRLDGAGANFGLRTHIQVSAGTSVAGVEITIVDHYVWLTSVGW